MLAAVEGPYGKQLHLDDYGTVLLMATGIGISSQLPYVSQLLEGYHNCEVRTKKIALYWQVDRDSKCLYVAFRNDVLLSL
jgi:NAD(P)H-flavin reductase